MATEKDSIYDPKCILVTGGAGFIGSHVVIHLVKEFPECKIINLDKLDYCSSLKNLKEVEDAPNYMFVKGDVRSQDLVSHIFKSEKVDTVMHFAAQSHVDNSFGNSFLFTENNIMGTHVLLEAAKVHKVKRFIHVSTDEVYGTTSEGGEGVTESGMLDPTNPYAATKAGAEFLVRAYRHSFKLPTIITRGNNVFGPHQYPEKIIPKFYTQLKRGMKCTMHGTGENIRNYVYVKDVAEAFSKVLTCGVEGEIYNIASTNQVCNLDVAKDLCSLLGIDDWKAQLDFVDDRPFNDLRYNIDASKLEELGWKQKTDWMEGLKKTVEWYDAHIDNWEGYEAALVAHPRREAQS